MKSNEQLWKICLEIYKDMYKVATPSADFDTLVEDGITQKQNWFLYYYLSEDRQTAIIEKHCIENNLSKLEKGKIHLTVYLGSAPSSCKERVEAMWGKKYE